MAGPHRQEDSLRGAVQIFVLPGAQRPQQDCEPHQAQQDRDRGENDGVTHRCKCSLPFAAQAPRERPEFGYTFSPGIGTAQADDTVADVLARADTALYSAKIALRNRIHLAA